MASTYVNDLRLNEMATGDASGTWGTITNTNLELIGEALGYATQDCFASDADATTTVADGATDPARAIYFKVTSSATLTATRTLTIAPNTVSRLQFIENATTGSQSINISQGSGANVTIGSGETKAVYLDGAGSGAAVVDSFATFSVANARFADGSNSAPSISFTSDTNTGIYRGGTDILKFVTAGTDAITIDASQNVTIGNNLSITGNGSTSDLTGSNIFRIMGDDVRITNSAGSEAMATSTADGAVTLYHDGNPKLATTSTGINVTGNIANASGDFTLDVAGDIILDAGGGDIKFFSGGTEFGEFRNISDDLVLISSVNDKDIVFKGQDGGSEITALTLDMSDSGTAIFNNDIDQPNSNSFIKGSGHNVVQTDTNTTYFYGGVNGIQLRKADNSYYNTQFSDNGAVIFNENGNDADFRVETLGNSHMFFVDGGTNRVGIGTGTPVTNLDVYGNINLRDGYNITWGGTYGANIPSIIATGGAGANIRFYPAGNTTGEKMRMTSDGVLLVGQTTFNPANVGTSMTSSGQLNGTANNDISLQLNRNSSQGAIVEFRKDNSTIGIIGTNGELGIGDEDVGIYFSPSTDSIIPCNPASTFINRANAIDLGYETVPFKDLRLSGGVYLGGTGSSNYLQDYEQGTWTPSMGGTTTYYYQTGEYTKIGNMVFLRGQVSINTIGTGSVSTINGLPFASKTTLNGNPAGSLTVTYYSGLAISINYIGGHVISAATTITIIGNAGNNTTIQYNGGNFFGNGARLDFTMAYQVA